MKIFISIQILLVLTFSSQVLYAQDLSIDSLQKVIRNFQRHFISVKSGNPNLSQFRDFCHVVKDAAIGVFITLEDPTKPMLTEAAKMGKYN